MAFSASDAAFEGFRIVRREPGTVAIWAVLLMIASAATIAIMLPTMRDLMANMPAPGAARTPTSLAASTAILASMGRLYLVGVPLYLIFMSVFMGGVYRAVLRPQEKGVARLRLGGDELRLMGLFVLMGILGFAVGVVVLLIGAVCVAVASAALKGTPAAFGAAFVVLYLVFLAAYAWVAVRLSFAAPMTFAQQKIRLFSSWRLTKGRFWPLLGCYLLALVFVILVGLVDAAVSGVLAIGLSGGSISRAATGLFRPDYSSLASLFTPIYMLRLLIGGAFGMVMWTVMLAPPAAAYREIVAPRPEDQAETFA